MSNVNYGYVEIPSATHGDFKIRKGSLVHTSEDARCPHCNTVIGTQPVIGEVVKIWVKPNSGFCEMGDRMLLELADGRYIHGDSENGFSLIKVANAK